MTTILVRTNVSAQIRVAGAAAHPEPPIRLRRPILVTPFLARSICLAAHRDARFEIGIKSFELRASEVRILATTGAFRVVPAKDLLDHRGRPADPRHGDLWQLREAGLVHTVPYVVGREKTSLVTLTDRGRDLLESASASRCSRAASGVLRWHREAARVGARRSALPGVSARRRAPPQSRRRVRRVVLDYELKRDYQRFLGERSS